MAARWTIRGLLASFKTVLWVLIAATAFAASALYHVRLPLARRLVRDVVTRIVSHEIKGSLRIGRIAEISPARVVVYRARLLDPQGRAVIRAARIELTPDFSDIRNGVVRIANARVERGSIVLYPSDTSAASFFDAVTPRDSTPSKSEPIRVQIDNIHASSMTLHGTFLGLEGFRIVNAEGLLSIAIQRDVDLTLHRASGQFVEPFPFLGVVDNVAGTVSTDSYRGIRLTAAAHTGEERAHATIGYYASSERPAPRTAAPEPVSELHLGVEFENVRSSSIVGLGHEWADILNTTLTGKFGLDGPVENLKLTATGVSTGGTVNVSGRITADDAVAIHIEGSDIEVARVLDDAPDIKLTAAVDLRVDLSPKARPTRLTIHAEPFVYDTLAVPTLEIDGDLHPDHYRITKVTTHLGNGHVRGRGAVFFDGAYRLELEAEGVALKRDPNFAKRLPGSSGMLSADIVVHRGPTVNDEPQEPRFEGTAHIADAVLGPMQATSLDARGTVIGFGGIPGAALSLSGENVRVYGYSAGRVQVDVQRESVGAYRFRARSALKDNRVAEARGMLETHANGFVVNAPVLEVSAGDARYNGGIVLSYNNVRESLLLQDVTLRRGDQIASLSQSSESSTSRTRLRLQRIRLTDWAPLFPESPRMLPQGAIDADVQLAGALGTPGFRLTLIGRATDVTYAGLALSSVQADVQQTDAAWTAEATADLKAGGKAALEAHGVTESSAASLLSWLTASRFDASVRWRDIPAKVLHDTLGIVPEAAAGSTSGSVSGSFNALRFNFDVQADAQGKWLPDWPAMTLQGRGAWSDQAYSGAVDVGDEFGKLVHLGYSLSSTPLTRVFGPERQAPFTLPWAIEATVPTRRLDRLPAPVALPLPLEANVTVKLANSIEGLRGELVSSGTFRIPWSGAPPPTLKVYSALKDDRLDHTIEIQEAGRRRFQLLANSRAPTLDSKNGKRTLHLYPIDVTAKFGAFPMRLLPGFHPRLGGRLSGEAAFAGLLGEAPTGRASLACTEFQAASATPFDTELQLIVEPHSLSIESETTDQTAGEMTIKGQLPIAWDVGRLLPRLRERAPVSVNAEFSGVHLEPLFLLVDALGPSNAVGTGTLRVAGTTSDPKFTGELNISNGTIQLAATGQRLDGVSARLLGQERRLRIERLSGHDGNGRATVRGYVDFDAFSAKRAAFEIDSRAFPLRQEGRVVANVTGDGTFAAVFEKDAVRANLRTNTVTIRLPDTNPKNLQELEAHPDIVVLGTRDDDEDLRPGKPWVLDLVSSRPFWVRRADFSVLTSVKLNAVYLEPDLSVSGYLYMQRGFFEVFGKRFEIQKGTLNFDGSNRLNPVVDLEAFYQVPGRPGAVIELDVSGRLEQPEIKFSASSLGITDQSEIIAVLVTGRRQIAASPTQTTAGGSPPGQNGATEQTASFLAGLTAGVLTLSARREFGDVLPVISVESGGQGFQSARVRAGFQADRLIPNFMRGFVKGSYIEGVFTAASNDASTQSGVATGGTIGAPTRSATGIGFLIELLFPANFVGTGSFTPPSNWGVDLTWEP